MYHKGQNSSLILTNIVYTRVKLEIKF